MNLKYELIIAYRMSSQKEQEIIQATNASDYATFLTITRKSYPSLNLSQVSKMAKILLKARKQWVENLEPTPATLAEKLNTSDTSFHELWPNVDNVSSSKPGLAIKTYDSIIKKGLIEPFESHGYPPLPPSPVPDDLEGDA